VLIAPVKENKGNKAVGKENESVHTSKRKSERIASRPKSNLIMQEQATRLLMKKCGIVDTNNNLEEGQLEKFRLQFVEPMKEMTVQGLRETFRPNGN